MKTSISNISHFKTKLSFTISSRIKKIKEVKASFFSLALSSSDYEADSGAYSINDYYIYNETFS